MIGQSFEVYIDDMLVKGLDFTSHLTHLEQVFAKLLAFCLKLNLEKCTFGCASRLFLGSC